MKPNIIAKILDLCTVVDDWLDGDVRTLAAEIRAALEPAQEEAPCPWVWDGDVLRVNGAPIGDVWDNAGEWVADWYQHGARLVDDKFTARALLVAMAGFDPVVTFVLSLSPAWTRKGIDAARDHGFGCYLAGMLEGYAEGYDDPQHVDDPEVVRRWWASGSDAINLSAKERSDDNPF